MLTNFDLIWMHTKSLADKLMATSENLYDEKLYQQYCSSFDQLIDILNNPSEAYDQAKLEDIRITVHALEKAYADEQASLRNSINTERMKAKVSQAYRSFNRLAGYSKKT